MSEDSKTNAPSGTQPFTPIDQLLFESRTVQPLTAILPELKGAEAGGLLTIGPERIAPTLRGRRFLNVLLERFLDDGDTA